MVNDCGKGWLPLVVLGTCRAECSLLLEWEPRGLEDEVRRALSQDPLQPRIQSNSRLTLKPPEPASVLYDNTFHTSHPAKSVSYIITCEVGLAQPGGEHVTFSPLCSSFSGTSTIPGRGLWCPVCAPPLSPSASYPLRCGFPAGLPPCLSRARETVGMLEANNSAPLQADGP